MDGRLSSGPARRDLLEEQWVRYVRWTLWFCGAMYVVLGFAAAALFLALPALTRGTSDEMPLFLGVILAIFVFFVSVAFGAGNFVISRGLALGRKWGWIGGLILGGIYAPSGCLPFGVIILYGLLREPTRKLYGM